jgi:NtrC-family two-component system response regulator AlgB
MSNPDGGTASRNNAENPESGVARSVPPSANPLRILVVDDEQTIRITLTLCLEADGHSVVSCGTADDALNEVRSRAFDLIFLDLRLGLDNGLDLIPHFLRENPRTKVVVITAYASVATAVEAMKRGATDYLPKPFTPVEVQFVTQKVADRRKLEWQVEALQDALGRMDPEADFPTASHAMQQTLSLARQVSTSKATVMICGEAGTGKGRLARAIHAWSERSASPFGSVACDTTDAEHLEEELFGVFAGADNPTQDRPGRIAFCESGTLVLDEVAQTPPSLQPKLLRLLSEKEYERAGDFRPRKANVRFIATSSVDLQDAVKRRRLRPELLLALDVVRITIPPLRHRPEDLKLLARCYLAYFSRENHRPILGIRGEAMHVLATHTWPGNTRELRNVIERAVLLCDKDYIELEHLPPNLMLEERAHSVGDLVPLETIEEMHIRSVLATTGTIKGAAAVLGINPSTLSRRLKRGDPGADSGGESGGEASDETANDAAAGGGEIHEATHGKSST